MTTPSISEALAALEERLSAGSLAHCERVSEEARSIAGAYGVDESDAALAGILHDWSRDSDDETLLEEAERFGLSVNAVEHSRPYLLHARIAAEEIRDEFPGIAEDVLEAVESHTLGGTDMSDLAMVVYVADMIESSRTWEGVGGLRDAVGKVPLEELFVRALQHTLEGLVARRRRIHPRAIEAWNALVDVRLP